MPSVGRTIWKVPVHERDPRRGFEEAIVTVVVFGDFECPHTARLRPTLARMLEAHRKDVRIVWKNRPGPSHPNAGRAALAALAAHAQGKFWEMHDLLLDNLQHLDAAAIAGYAEQIGLNVETFQAALAQGAHKEHLSRDVAAARAAGADRTPTLFVNGRKVAGAVPFEAIDALLQEEIAKARKMLAAGVSRNRVYHQLMLLGKTVGQK